MLGGWATRRSGQRGQRVGLHLARFRRWRYDSPSLNGFRAVGLLVLVVFSSAVIVYRFHLFFDTIGNRWMGYVMISFLGGAVAHETHRAACSRTCSSTGRSSSAGNRKPAWAPPSASSTRRTLIIIRPRALHLRRHVVPELACWRWPEGQVEAPFSASASAWNCACVFRLLHRVQGGDHRAVVLAADAGRAGRASTS